MSKILQMVGDFGPDLPTVTDEDNGKVLKAQDGKWTAQEDETATPLSNLDIEAILSNY